MRFLVDESTGRRVTEFLRKNGHDVVFVPELMSGAGDREILEAASKDERIVVTNDRDFGRLAVRLGLRSHGVLLLRPRNDNAEKRVAILEGILLGHAPRLPGSFTVASEAGVRIRPLP